MRFEEQLVFLVGRFGAGMVIPLLILVIANRFAVRDRYPTLVYGTCAVFAAAMPFVGVSEAGKILLSGYAALFGVVCIFWGYGATLQRLATKKTKKTKKRR